MGKYGKRYSQEERSRILTEIEKGLAQGTPVSQACKSAGISDKTYYSWQGSKKRLGLRSKKIVHEVVPISSPVVSIERNSRLTISGSPQELGEFFRALVGHA